MKARLLAGDCQQRLKDLPEHSVDSIVTDPPYGISFMGRRWDYDVPNVGIWKECLRVLKPGGYLLAFAGTRTQHRMAVRIEDAGFEIRDMIAWVYGNGFPKSHNLKGEWTGWGTALKPAMEPITVARKPLAGTVAENVRTYRTGALNIDACRVGTPPGRWPANLIHDGADNVVALFPENAGQQAALKTRSGDRARNTFGAFQGTPNVNFAPHDARGSASRFFYCAKATKADRGIENNQPTVKPTDLMRYLCRLVTPLGGLVLDPFMGSGSTGKAAILEGFGFIGIERDADALQTAKHRIAVVCKDIRGAKHSVSQARRTHTDAEEDKNQNR